QRVGHQAIRLDRVVALVADPVGPLVHARQGVVHLAQQPTHLLVRGYRDTRALQLLASLRQLVPQERLDRGRHAFPPRLSDGAAGGRGWNIREGGGGGWGLGRGRGGGGLMLARAGRPRSRESARRGSKSPPPARPRRSPPRHFEDKPRCSFLTRSHV